MPAISNVLVARDAMSTLAKRENWAQQEAGVIVVFCIVFIVGVGVLGIMIAKCVKKQRAKKAVPAA